MFSESALKSMALAALLYFLSVSTLFPNNTNWQWTHSAQMGMQWGLSKEIVYPVSRHSSRNKYLSLLTWDMFQIPTIGISTSAKGIRNWGFEIAFDTAIPNVPSGYMNDYDWFFTDKDWSHWTRHETTLRWGFVADLSVHWRIKETKNFVLHTGIAYHFDSWAWTDDFKENVYSFASSKITDTLPRPFDAANGDKFRNEVNTIGAGSYVDYEVAFHTVLAAIQAQFVFKKIFTSLTTRIGPALISSIDNHKHRFASTGELGLLFHNLGLGFPWIDGTLELGIHISDNLSFTIRGSIAWMPETQANTTIYDGKGTYISTSMGAGGFDLLRGGASVLLSWTHSSRDKTLQK